MQRSNTPQGQDNTARHESDSQNSGALSNAFTPVASNPTAPSEGGDSRHNPSPPPWWKRIHWQLIVEVAVLLVGIRVAFIYSAQLDQMIESNRTNRDTLTELQNETRPWMGLSRPITTETLFVIQPSRIYVKLAIRAKNYGKSPAFRVAAQTLPMLDEGEWEDLSKRSCRLAEADVKSGVGSYTFPDQESFLAPEVTSDAPHKEIVTIYVAGCIAYLDQGLKTVHHTRFCAQTTQPDKFTFKNELSPCNVSQNAD